MKPQTSTSTGQDRLLDVIETVKGLRDASLAMSSAQTAKVMQGILGQLVATNTEIAAQMAELIAAKPDHCCCCNRTFPAPYIYNGLCDYCYEDRIA